MAAPVSIDGALNLPMGPRRAQSAARTNAAATQPPVLAQMLRLQQMAGNGAVARRIAEQTLPIQRLMVESWILGRTDEGRRYWQDDDTTPGGQPFKPSKGTETYRKAAEDALGSTGPLNILSRRGVLVMPPVHGSSRPAYDRSHLIAGSFLGEQKFPVAQSNLRFFPDDLEDGEWQAAEAKVTQLLDRDAPRWKGRVKVSITEGSVRAADLAQAILERAGLDGTLQALLADKLKAVQAVPSHATLALNPDGGETPQPMVDKGGLDGYLRLGAAAPEAICGALSEIGLPVPSSKLPSRVRDLPTQKDAEAFIEGVVAASPKLDAKVKLKTLTQKVQAFQSLLEKGKPSPETLKAFLDGVYRTAYGMALPHDVPTRYTFGWLNHTG